MKGMVINMDFTKLEQNICDVIKEEQIKLGYRKEVVRLFYPLLSLNRFLKTDMGVEKMLKVLEEFCEIEAEKLGRITVSNEGERFCFCLPPKASEYIHESTIYEHTKQDDFLYDFINTVSRHGVTIDEVIDQFKKYSDCVRVEKAMHGEFDYLIYFEDGNPDSYRYCLTDEGCHIIYHRFTIDDYNDFNFE
jgi:hypothetical protein